MVDSLDIKVGFIIIGFDFLIVRMLLPDGGT
jgi:hypothetical protein